MGSFDGAEICELVGLYLLHAITQLLNTNDVGLYRDDGLAVLRNNAGPQTEQLKKKLIKLFQKNTLSITTETGLIQTDFLDVTFNLLSGTQRPFRKPNDNPQYVHSSSNHPPNIKKQLPAMISKRLSQNSCNKEEFNKAISEYEEALRKSGCNAKLQYEETTKPKKKNRKRNIIWFNSPFNATVKTNVGREFFKLMNTHFPATTRSTKFATRTMSN